MQNIKIHSEYQDEHSEPELTLTLKQDTKSTNTHTDYYDKQSTKTQTEYQDTHTGYQDIHTKGTRHTQDTKANT